MPLDEQGNYYEPVEDTAPQPSEPTESAPVEQPEESAPESTEEIAEEQGPKPYTPEELEELLATDGTIDRKRLTPEGQALMKSFQRGYTPKLERLSKLEKEIESLKSPKKQPETLEEQFEQDPKGTVGQINAYIASKQQEAMYYKYNGDIDKAEAAANEILKWTDIKSTLATNALIKVKDDIKHNRAKDKLVTSLPDFDTRLDIAISTMVDQTKLSKEEVENLLDVETQGKKAVELIKHFYGIYEKSHAKVSAKEKIKKETPSQLGHPGGAQMTTSQPVSKEYATVFAKWKENPDDPVLTQKVFELKKVI